jgi:hypothetical protein
MEHATNNNPNKDSKEITVTLPNASIQIFCINHDGSRAYPKGSSKYWTIEQFNAALDKMRAAGAVVEIVTLTTCG